MATTYMSLVLPTPTVTPGPLYTYENNQALTVIDSHNHTPGNGAPILSASISINADLPFNSYNATLLRSTRYVDQSAALALPTDIGIIYTVGGDLYYNNSIGQAIQLTAGAALNAASIGGIGGDYGTSTASEFYTSAMSTFTFWSAPSIPAIIDSGPIILRNVAISSFGITLSPPITLSADYSLTLPGSLPASTKILTVDSSGNIAFVYDVDNSTLEVSSNTLRVKDAGITLAKMATNSVDTSKIIDQSVTQAKMAPMPESTTAGAGEIAISNAIGTDFANGAGFADITNLSFTLVTTGRPVYVALIGDGVSQSSVYLSNASTAGTAEAKIKFVRDTTDISLQNISAQQAAVLVGQAAYSWPSSSFNTIDRGVIAAPGTYTYKAQFGGSTSTSFYIYVANVRLIAYEI